MKTLKFQRTQNKEFVKELMGAVEGYFKEKKVSKYGNAEMVIKSIVMLSLYFGPFIAMLLGVVTTPIWIYFMWIIMGFAISGIGLCIMHDANHGSYSKNKTINKLMGQTLNLVGGHYENWKIQHNQLHHTFTNLHGMDPDISPPPLVRFSPDAPLLKIHKFQFIYGWLLYGLMTFTWVLNKEFMQIYQFKKDGHIPAEQFPKKVFELILWKVFYYAYILGLPMLFMDISFGFWFLGFFSMHFIAGLSLATIFQTAHVMPECEYPHVADDGNMEENWFVHQLQTTSNYSPNNRVFSWFVGGLNFQVEHHLFPKICHVHYRELAPIVKEVCERNNLPYKSQRTYVGAVWEHTKMLYRLGRA